MSFFPPGFFHRQLLYTPPKPVGSFKGKTVIITGSNVGLGLEASRWIAQLGASKVILACRNIEKGRTAAKDIQSNTLCTPDILEVWKLDMSSYASVQEFAAKAQNELPRLDAVLANAGMTSHTFRMTEDNEQTITTNVVSTALLMCLLHPKLRETAEKYKTQTHLTVTGSEMHAIAKFAESKAPQGEIFATLADKSKANMMDRYGTSKLLVLFAMQQIAALTPLSSSDVIVNYIAPGFCRSSLGREAEGMLLYRIFVALFARTTEVGSRALVHGILAGPETHGQYVPDCKIAPSEGLSKGAEGAELGNRVWEELRVKLESIKPGVTQLGSV